MTRRGPKLKGPVTPAQFEEFEKLLAIQCTLEEVAAFYGVDVKTIQTRCEEHYGMKFSQVFEQKRSTGKISLRRKQYQKALEGNVSMLIWLGKQYLNQSEKVQEVSNSPDDALDELSVEELQAEIDKRKDRYAEVKLKSKDPAAYEKELVEKIKKKGKKTP